MSMAIVDGALLKNDRDFYVTVAQQIDFGVGYGNNYHAFDDRLGFDLERPIHITWKITRFLKLSGAIVSN